MRCLTRRKRAEVVRLSNALKDLTSTQQPVQRLSATHLLTAPRVQNTEYSRDASTTLRSR